MMSVKYNLVIAVIFIMKWGYIQGGPTPAVEDYPNDYYNDEEYYSDNYDTDSVSDEKETIVKRNPKFISQSKRITINEGDTIKLPCMVDNLDDLVIIWRKGDTILSLGDNFVSSDKRIKVEKSEHGSQLVISLSEEVDSGEYSCQVSTTNTIQLTHHVTVRVRPSVSPVPAKGLMKVVEGEAAELRCKVTQGSPEPDITWKRKSRPFVSGESSLSGQSIVFPKTNRHHSGIYYCFADNGWGSPARAEIRLDVQHKPEIEQEETFIHSRDGDEVEITCTIHASPKAEVEWYRNGQLLDPREMVTSTRGNRHTLMLHRIGEREIHGKYDCRARNDYGEAMATTEVSGKAAPANFKSSKMSEDERSYTLEWVVTSTSPVTEFQVEYRMEDAAERWENLTVEVVKVGAESYSGRVTLEGLHPATKYQARVAAKNSYGFNSFSSNFDFWTYYDVEVMKTSEPKHEKSVSGSPTLGFSLMVGVLSSLLLLTR